MCVDVVMKCIRDDGRWEEGAGGGGGVDNSTMCAVCELCGRMGCELGWTDMVGKNVSILNRSLYWEWVLRLGYYWV